MGKLSANDKEHGHSNKTVTTITTTSEMLLNRYSIKKCCCGNDCNSGYCCKCDCNESCTDTEQSILDLDKEKLLYRAEGNANLVLSLPDYKNVLRLRKTSNIYGHDVVVETESDDKTNLCLSVEYIKLISTIIGQPYICQPEIVQLKVHSYESFNKWLRPMRPVERLDKEVHCTMGILYPDVTFLPDALCSVSGCGEELIKSNSSDTFSVEIKPKQGWTFNKNEFSANGLINLDDIQKCRFCSMQYLKLQKKTIKNISGYCPIDLFSGHTTRMKRAINELIKSPQNNFCILKNGKLIYGNKSHPSEIVSIFNDIFGSTQSPKKNNLNFVNLIIKILLNEFLDGSKTKQRLWSNSFEANNQSFQCEEVIPSILPENCILKKILELQLMAKLSLCTSNTIKETTHQHAYTYIINLLNTFKNYSGTPVSEFLNHLDFDEKYLFGATALDCSIMLTFKILSENELERIKDLNEKHLISIGGHQVLANVTVMDLDPKPIQHFAKYIRQTNASHQAYRQSTN